MAAPTPEQQAILDTQWDRVTDKVSAKVWSITTNPDILALQNKALFAAQTGQGSSFAAQIASILGQLNVIAAVRPFKLVKVTGDATGAVYAVAPGVFRHIADGATLDAGTAAGLWGGAGDVREITAAQRDQLVAFTAAANGVAS